MFGKGQNEITRVFEAIEAGDEQAQERLVDLVYDELKRIARGRLKQEHDRGSLSTTVVVHEVILRLGLLEKGGLARFKNRPTFFGAVARAMGQVLVDHARSRKAAKRGGGMKKEPLTLVLDRLVQNLEETLHVDFLDLHEALEELRDTLPREHKVIVLRWFGGLTEEEAAEDLGVSRSTVQEAWRFARAWLRRRLGGAA